MCQLPVTVLVKVRGPKKPNVTLVDLPGFHTADDDDTGSGTTTLEVYVGLDLTITKRSITHSWVRWPAIFTGFALETAPALPAGANWTVVFDAPALSNGQWEVLVTHTAGNAFFRLVKP